MAFTATAVSGAHEPTLRCPNCNHEIRLTESLAAPLIEETRRRFQEQLANKDAEMAQKIEVLREAREKLADDRDKLEDDIAAPCRGTKSDSGGRSKKGSRGSGG